MSDLYKAKYKGQLRDLTAKEWSCLIGKDARLDDITQTAIRERRNRVKRGEANYTPEQIVGAETIIYKKITNNTPMDTPAAMIGILQNAEFLKRGLMRS